MELIPSIDLLSERTRPDCNELQHSDYHRCQLNMWFKYRNVMPIKYDVRKTLMAENLKSTVRRWVQASGYKIAKTGATLSTGYTIDGICHKDEWQLLDIRVCSSKMFKRLVKHGLGDPERVELSSAMLASGELSAHGNMLNSCLTLLVNRDTLDSATIRTTVEPDLIEVVDQLQGQAMDSESPPVRDKGYWCNWCDYRDFCENNQLATVSCRTCAHISVMGGELVCDHGVKTCINHLYHPELMRFAGYTMVAADPSGTVEYEEFANVSELGRRVKGKANMTSHEIYRAAGAKNLQDDPMLLKLMAIFDGRLEDANAIT